MDDKWFKQQQKRVGVTADDIARKMGRTRANVSHILTGRQRMSLDWAKAFSEVLQVPLATVLEKAGVTDAPTLQAVTPGFAESDAAPWVAGPEPTSAREVSTVAQALGGNRPGVDVWRVKGQVMALYGLLAGDFLLVDSHQADKVKPGDVVVAQVYSPKGATTVLRRYEPPVLISASTDPTEGKVHVVDGINVVIRGKVVASWRV
jgi:SOS-response transcriptional repressor LexA